MTLTMKERVGRKWENVDMTPMVGITMECLLANYADHPAAVAEMVLDNGTKAYLCSTQEWVDFFQGRGDKAALIEPGLKALGISHPDFLDGLLPPLCQVAAEIFGATVQEVGDVNQGSGREKLGAPGRRAPGYQRKGKPASRV